MYADDSFVNTQAGTEFSSDGKSWTGNRALDDGTVITKSEGYSAAIAQANGNKFVGTAKKKVDPCSRQKLTAILPM